MIVDEISSMDILYGVSMMSISIIFILLYIPVVLGFSAKADTTSVPFTFRLMIYVSLSDMLQLACHLLTGLSLLFGISKEHHMFKVLGAILAASWFLMLMFTLTLAIHRFVLIIFQNIASVVLRPVVTLSVSLLNFSVWIVVFVLNLTPYSSMFYDFEKHYWHYDTTKPFSKGFDEINDILMITVCVASLILYLIIFGNIYLKQKSLNKKEMRTAFQMFSYCIFTAFVSIVWLLGDDLFPDSPLLWFFIDLLWPLWNGANAILYLVFNRSLRESLRTISVRSNAVRPKLSST